MGSRGTSGVGIGGGFAATGSGSQGISIQSTPNSQVQSVPAQNIVQTSQQMQSANNANFSATDTQGYHDLYNGRQYFNNQVIDIDTETARQDYISDNPEPGSLYSISQNLNWALKNGHTLTPNQQFMSDVLSDAMHNLGYNLNLQRYDHMGFVEALGVKNYWNYSEAQLKNMLVGTQYSEAGFVSTSYNNFKNAPSGNPFTDREIKISYRAPANARAFMPGDGRGGRLGEIILDKNQNYRIVDVKYTGQQGRNKSRRYPQLEFIVELV